jgi:hypothetical protein
MKSEKERDSLSLNMHTGMERCSRNGGTLNFRDVSVEREYYAE